MKRFQNRRIIWLVGFLIMSLALLALTLATPGTAASPTQEQTDIVEIKLGQFESRACIYVTEGRYRYRLEATNNDFQMEAVTTTLHLIWGPLPQRQMITETLSQGRGHAGARSDWLPDSAVKDGVVTLSLQAKCDSFRRCNGDAFREFTLPTLGPTPTITATATPTDTTGINWCNPLNLNIDSIKAAPHYEDFVPSNAFDIDESGCQNPNTHFVVGSPRGWIELALGETTTVRGIGLDVGPAGDGALCVVLGDDQGSNPGQHPELGRLEAPEGWEANTELVIEFAEAVEVNVLELQCDFKTFWFDLYRGTWW